MTNTDANADLRAARRALADDVTDFDNKGRPCSKEEWRYKFLRATRKVTPKQRAELWADKLAFKGEAYNWLQAQKKDTTNKDLVGDWTTLEPLIKARWPTPVPDQDAYEEAQRAQFMTSFMNIQAWSDILCDPTNPARPQQHLPAFVIPLLPKGWNYAKDFDTLCKHIGELSNRKLYNAWRDRALLESIGSLSLSIPPTASSPSPHSRSALPAAARAMSALKTSSVALATPK
ncbi:Retrovirus-related Pol polyprotein from transposon [Ceratobasidium sp. AG-Ba]|nr:Retrovirus-related Pol polyprotein from transposon [Ceratobasidium sp. AG-Ba]